MSRYPLILFSMACVIVDNSHAADAVADTAKNTYSVTMENLISGEKSRIVVSGPNDSEPQQTRELAEKLAREAFGGGGFSQKTENGNTILSQNPEFLKEGKYWAPKDFVYIRPGYNENDQYAVIPGYSTNSLEGLVAENQKLRELVKLQEEKISLLQTQLSSLQGR